jgi:hypothetical protein
MTAVADYRADRVAHRHRGRQQPAGAADPTAGRVTSVPDITRQLARIAEWQDGHGKPGGRADAARRLEEAHKLLPVPAWRLT